MGKKDDVNKLLGNLKSSAETANAPAIYTREVNLSYYKENHAWPGRNYIYIGNSFNIKKKIQSPNSRESRKRAACIAMMLEKGKGNRNCLSIGEALQHEGFKECLSRFEYDWLVREAHETLLGPAYNDKGELLPLAFTVWRKMPTPVQQNSKQGKKLAKAGKA